MGKKKRGGYIFIYYIADHCPKHVHVYNKNGLVCKWDIENWKPMKKEQSIPSSLKKYLKELFGENK